jgi:serine/threonine-protein kinase
MTSPPSSNWNGRFVGDNERYRIDKPLAAGGMGEVLLATDTRLGQQVVLKLLKGTLVASQEMKKRFEREIEICAALQNDHIVKISDCGVTPEGYPFYAMEYLRGQTLRQLLQRERRLSIERTVSIISQVCKGLQMAHQGVNLQKGNGSEHIKVVHRDLKPDNIFLVPTDLGEWIKILDFGVAKIRNESSEQSSLTMANAFIGTFRYAAPEQIQNKENLDPRADIYSLGIILYEMLSAADPFGFSIQGSSISEYSWFLAHVQKPPKPLRSQPGCENLSAEIEAVVSKCLEKNPHKRFASVAELNDALQAAIKSAVDHPVTTHELTTVQTQPTPPETVSKPPKAFDASESEEDTVIYVQPSHHQSLDEETINRPVDPVFPNQSSHHQSLDEETINRPVDPVFPNQPSHHQSLDNETINRPANPVFPNQPDYNQGSGSEQLEVKNYLQPPAPEPAINQAPVPQPQTPTIPKPPEGTIVQLPPTSNVAENSESVAQTPTPIPPQPTEENKSSRSPAPYAPKKKATTPQVVQPSNPAPIEGTIVQPLPTSDAAFNQGTTPELFQITNPAPIEGTIVQIPPTPDVAGNQANAPLEGTIVQPPPAAGATINHNSAPLEGTIVQPPPAAGAAINHNSAPLEWTIVQTNSSGDPRPRETPANRQPNHIQRNNTESTQYQPRPAINPRVNNTPDYTIVQPKSNDSENPKNNRMLGQYLWIGLVVVVATVVAAILIFFLQSNQSSKTSPTEQKSIPQN